MIWVSGTMKCLRYVSKYYSVYLHTTYIFCMEVYLELFWACFIVLLSLEISFLQLLYLICLFFCAPVFVSVKINRNLKSISAVIFDKYVISKMKLSQIISCSGLHIFFKRTNQIDSVVYLDI